jgi:hypothetical protein
MQTIGNASAGVLDSRIRGNDMGSKCVILRVTPPPVLGIWRVKMTTREMGWTVRLAHPISEEGSIFRRRLDQKLSFRES